MSDSDRSTAVPGSADAESKEDRARRIFGERAAFYTTSSVHTDPAVLARVVELAAPESTWIALDVATGTGHTAFALAGQVARVIATDITPEMLAEAEGLRKAQGVDNVEFLRHDAHVLPFANASFDLVTCRRAAHHFSDLTVALGEMHRVLRPGGRLVIDDRSVPEDDFGDATMNELDRLHDGSHVREYRPSEWRASLTAGGFTVDAVETYEKHRPLSSLMNGVVEEDILEIRAILNGFTPEQVKLFDLREVKGELYCLHWFLTVAATKAP